MSSDLFEIVPLLRRITVHPAIRDLGFLGASTFLTAVAAMVVISLVGKAFGATLLGEYLLIRRMASWLQAGVQLPSGVALPRYVAASLDDPESPKVTYFVAALGSACGIGLLICLVLAVWRIRISQLFFGSTRLDHLVFPLSLLLLGLAVHGVVFGYLQGILAMGRASMLQTCNLVMIPILTTVLFRPLHSIALIVDAMGVLMIACAVLFALPILPKSGLSLSTGKLKKHSSELLSYGFARVSGDFGLQAILSLPAVIAAHYFPMSSVALLLLAGSFLGVVSAATLPLGMVMLSRVSRSMAQMRISQLQTQISYFVSALVELSLFIGLQLIVFCDVIVRAWVGSSFLEGIRVIQTVILGVPFYFVYAGLRNIIDAARVKAYNTKNVHIAAGAFLLSVVLVRVFVPDAHLLEGLAAAGVLGLAVLACCTLWTVGHLFEISVNWLRLLPGIGIGILFGGLSSSLHSWFRYQPHLFGLSLYEVSLSIIYLVALGILDAPLVRFLRDTMFTYTSPKGEAADS
jgi:O-antigen/teichoic acid export membrane protein